MVVNRMGIRNCIVAEVSVTLCGTKNWSLAYLAQTITMYKFNMFGVDAHNVMRQLSS